MSINLASDAMISCQCSALAEPAVLEFAYQRPRRDLDTFTQIAKRGMPWWWLYASHCNACGQDWLVAQEERLNDVYILRRLSIEEVEAIRESGAWPPALERYEDLLILGAQAGHHTRYADLNELAPIVQDVCADRPTISAEELAYLVNVSTADAQQLIAAWRATEPVSQRS